MSNLDLNKVASVIVVHERIMSALDGSTSIEHMTDAFQFLRLNDTHMIVLQDDEPVARTYIDQLTSKLFTEHQ